MNEEKNIKMMLSNLQVTSEAEVMRKMRKRGLRHEASNVH
jgi:ferredoxin-fold anticodon binding domain-containing protein